MFRLSIGDVHADSFDYQVLTTQCLGNLEKCHTKKVALFIWRSLCKTAANHSGPWLHRTYLVIGKSDEGKSTERFWDEHISNFSILHEKLPQIVGSHVLSAPTHKHFPAPHWLIGTGLLVKHIIRWTKGLPKKGLGRPICFLRWMNDVFKTKLTRREEGKT